MSEWRGATWALVIWNALMILWTADFAGGVGGCAGETGWAFSVCEAGRTVGTEMGIPFIVIVWSIGFAVIGLIWLMSRPKENVL